MANVKGGDKYKQKLADIARAVRKANTLRVGFLEGATYPDGQSVPLVAAFNEFGVPSHNQPPRPFFRRMIAAHKKEWPGAIANLYKANEYDAEKALTLAGEAISGQLRQSIVELVDPPLSPKTIARKKSAKPLIETGLMLQSVAYEVK